MSIFFIGITNVGSRRDQSWELGRLRLGWEYLSAKLLPTVFGWMCMYQFSARNCWSFVLVCLTPLRFGCVVKGMTN
jgi:hypothetical protein